MKTTPFTVTSKILNDTAEISELIGRVSTEKLSAEPMLRRTNRIQTINGTLAIEQNTLSLEQITAILNGKHIVAPAKDIKEVKNAFSLYDRIFEFEPFSVDSLLKAHKTMMDGIIEEAGMFRETPVGVADAMGNIIHIGTLPRYVPKSTEDLLQWVKESDLPMIIKSCIFHFEFEMIHPFSDGNGRTGRFWHTLLLTFQNPVFAWIPIESVIFTHQQEYYNALNSGDSDCDCTAFIEFMLDAIKEALLKSSDVTACIRANEQTLRIDFVMKFLQTHEYIMNNDICNEFGVSSATANRLLNLMKNNGFIERVHIGKYWGYQLK